MAAVIGIIVLILVVAFLAVILVRAALFRPKEEISEEDAAPFRAPVKLNKEKIISDMSDMIKCRTVSDRDFDAVDWDEFAKFRQLLKDRFPLVNKYATLTNIGRDGVLYHLKGKDDSAPIVFMAHYDVVPVNEDAWEKPPFSGIVEDDVMWGRGTLDTKGTLCGVMEAAEALLAEGFVPKQDLYFSFSGEEEIGGSTCHEIVMWLKEHGIRPAMVLDEGGAVVEGAFPGIPGETAMVGIAEKGSADFCLTMEGNGGHASTPPMKTLLGQLSQAIVNIEKHPFPRKFSEPVRNMLDQLGRHAGFGWRILFANMWCFTPLFDMVCKKTGGELNAMMRTTCAVTKMEGGKAYNVLPPKVSAGMNLRLMMGDTVDSAKEYLKKVIDNDNIDIQVVDGVNPSIVSTTECGEWQKLRCAIEATWTESLVSPYLMMARSDSRNYCEISDRVYRFSAMKLSKEERGSLIHGNNERVPISTLLKTVEFYIRLMREC